MHNAVRPITVELMDIRWSAIKAAAAYADGKADADECPHAPGTPEALEWQAAWDAEYTREQNLLRSFQ